MGEILLLSSQGYALKIEGHLAGKSLLFQEENDEGSFYEISKSYQIHLSLKGRPTGMT